MATKNYTIGMSWESWVEQLNAYMLSGEVALQIIEAEAAVNGVVPNAEAVKQRNTKRAALLIYRQSKESYHILKSLTSPKLPIECTYEDMIKLMGDYLEPKPTLLAERYHFYQCSQKEEENVQMFAVRLREQGYKCDFKTFVEEALRDRFLMGLRDSETRQLLLAEENLTITQAVAKAFTRERASLEATDMARLTVHKVTTGKVCKKCGLSGRCEEQCKTKCFRCREFGHIRRNCPNKTNRVHQIETEDNTACESSADEVDIIDLQFLELLSISHVSTISNVSEKKPMLNLKCSGCPIQFELDTGSSVSVVNLNTFSTSGLGAVVDLTPSDRVLKVANGGLERVCGKARVVVEVVRVGKNIVQELELYVVPGVFPSLLGRPWISSLFGDEWLSRVVGDKVESVRSQKGTYNPASVGAVKTGHQDLTVEGLVETKYQEVKGERSVEQLKQSIVFQKKLGCVVGFEAELNLKKESRPRFMKARPLPYALREAVEKQLKAMVTDGVLVPVTESEYATPVVPVMKPDGTVRICGDYKSTLNRSLVLHDYPIPNTEECFHEMVGGVKFSIVDISKAYNNLMLRESDQILTTINTHKGLYKSTRLPYGVSPGGSIFQEVMDKVLAGLSFVVCRIDDILISGRTNEDHLKNLNEVFRRLEKYGFSCKLSKCQFFQEELVYLGYKISKDGIAPVLSKVDDLVKAKAPEKVEEMISFLGAVNYYRRFLPDLSTVIEPLERLRGKGVKFVWGREQQESFCKLKKLLASGAVLCGFNPKLPVRLETDASGVGIGSVLTHVFPGGMHRPVEFISRTLSKAEKNYSQIEKEGLAIVWSVKRLHKYLYGRKWLLVTDHKPLTFIFAMDKEIPHMSVSRITRWAIFLMNYDYDLEYRRTKDHANADMLSRLPRVEGQEQKGSEVDEVTEVFQVTVAEAGLDAVLVAKETKRDVVLSRVVAFILNGWPGHCPEQEMRPYFEKRDELSIELGCITWGARVVVPRKMRPAILKVLHGTHMGMSATKSLARSYIWWDNLNRDIEEMCRQCEACAKYGASMPKVVDHPWVKPTGPWQRVHLDYAGPFKGSFWLILYDAYSKWPEVVNTGKVCNGRVTIKAMREIFARTGLPQLLVTDNGPSLVSEEMEIFLEGNGVTHLSTPTYHPPSNGCAEKFVSTFKASMKKMGESSVNQTEDLSHHVSRLLLNYRNTPHSETGQAPSVMMYGRLLRSLLHRVLPSDYKKKEELEAGRESKIVNGRNRSFEVSELVWVQIDDTKTWSQGTVVEVFGNSPFYTVEVQDRLIKKHVNHLKPRVVSTEAVPETRVENTVPERENAGVRVQSAARMLSERANTAQVAGLRQESVEVDEEREIGRRGFQRLKPVIELTKSSYSPVCDSGVRLESVGTGCEVSCEVSKPPEVPEVRIPRELARLQSPLLGAEGSTELCSEVPEGPRRSRRLQS